MEPSTGGADCQRYCHMTACRCADLVAMVRASWHLHTRAWVVLPLLLLPDQDVVPCLLLPKQGHTTPADTHVHQNTQASFGPDYKSPVPHDACYLRCLDCSMVYILTPYAVSASTICRPFLMHTQRLAQPYTLSPRAGLGRGSFAYHDTNWP